MIVAHMISPEIVSRLLAKATSEKGVFFRSLTADYATQSEVLSLEGSVNSGGRFNIRNEFGALYVASDAHIAFDESVYTNQRTGWLRYKPKTIVGIEFQPLATLDLDDERIRSRLGVRESDLSVDYFRKNESGDIVITQILGRIAREVGFEAIRMHSLRGKATNLAVFLDKVPEWKVKVIHIDRLPNIAF